MQNLKNLMASALVTTGVLGFATTQAAAQNAASDEVFALARVGDAALPALVEQQDDCREEVLSGTLTLKKDGRWTMVTRERETCGSKVEEEEESEDGKYVVEGTTIRFSEMPAASAANDEKNSSVAQTGEFDLDVEDLLVGTRTAEGLNVRLRDGKTVVVFRSTASR